MKQRTSGIVLINIVMSNGVWFYWYSCSLNTMQYLLDSIREHRWHGCPLFHSITITFVIPPWVYL